MPLQTDKNDRNYRSDNISERQVLTEAVSHFSCLFFLGAGVGLGDESNQGKFM